MVVSSFRHLFAALVLHRAWAFRDSDGLGLGMEADSLSDEADSLPDDPPLVRGLFTEARDSPMNESNMTAATGVASFCDPRDTKPPQYCPDGTKCTDITGCGADAEKCACPKMHAHYCDPRDTMSPQYCRDGTKCADVAGCSADMEKCACPEVRTTMGDKIEAVRSDWLPNKYELTKIKNTLLKLLQYVPPELAGGVEGASVIAEYTESFGCDPFLTCESRPLRFDRVTGATLKFTAYIVKMIPGASWIGEMLSAASDILSASTGAPSVSLHYINAEIKKAVARGVRDLQHFHISRDLAAAEVQAIHLEDGTEEALRDIDILHCSDFLVERILHYSEHAGEILDTLLTTMDKVLDLAMIKQAMNDKMKEADELLRTIRLMDNICATWIVVAGGRFKLLSLTQGKFTHVGCQREAAVVNVHLNTTLLHSAWDRYNNSAARLRWEMHIRPVLQLKLVAAIEKESLACTWGCRMGEVMNTVSAQRFAPLLLNLGKGTGGWASFLENFLEIFSDHTWYKNQASPKSKMIYNVRDFLCDYGACSAIRKDPSALGVVGSKEFRTYVGNYSFPNASKAALVLAWASECRVRDLPVEPPNLDFPAGCYLFDNEAGQRRLSTKLPCGHHKWC